MRNLVYRFILFGLLFAVILALPKVVQCQEPFQITAISSKYLSPASLDSLTRAVLQQEAQAKNIGAAVFSERYDAYRYRVAELMQSFLTGPFTQLDREYQNNAVPAPAAFLTIRQQYEKLAISALQRIIGTPASIYPLLEMDNSDRILSFRSNLIVEKDGTIQVTETIRIYNGNGGALSENDEIKRGIVRDFPTKYRAAAGYWVHTGFKLESVTRDGKEEPYATQSLDNGTRVRIGNADDFLSVGVYAYVIKYRTNRQVIFHADRDELYWNVNGNGWSFRIDTAGAIVEFPGDAKVEAQQCYTGLAGSTEQHCHYTSLSDRSIAFTSTKGLKPYEGLTVAADIQKGIIQPPSQGSNWWNFLRSNWLVPLLIFLVSGILIFYWTIWRRKGKDPASGVIYPQFTPPTGLGPADIGYIYQQKYGSHLFVSSLVNAAVHGMLAIEVNKGKTWLSGTSYYFRKPDKTPELNSLPNDQLGITINSLYGLTLKSGTYNSTLKSLYNSLETTLKSRYLIRKGKSNSTKGYFALNQGYLLLGVFILVIAFAASVLFMVLNFTVPMAIFAGVSLLLLLIIQFVFYRILPAYTKEGRQVADHIEGFKLYLEQTEKKWFNELTPPEKTLDLFEKYLPYAIALKVENAWARQFDAILSRALAEGYQPTYFYTGHGFSQSLSFTDFSSGISSGLSSTISSASTPPSSSSGGSRGGGSSGGGGGGGGGGGW